MQTTETLLVDPDALFRMADLIGRRDPKTGKRVDPINAWFASRQGADGR